MWLWTVLLLLAVSFHSRAQVAGPNTPDPRVPRISETVPGELIVRFKPGATDDKKGKALKKVNGIARDINRRGIARKGTLAADAKVLKVEGNIDKVRATLAADPDVLYVEPNFKTRVFAQVIPNDFEFESLYGLYNTGANGGIAGADIKATEAWDITKGSSDIVVAVIDTGIDYFHEDLHANLWRNLGEIPGNGIDDDGNGYIDDVYGYDFVSGDSDPMDDHFHGSHVSGTIGAVGNNGIGVAGVCWNVRLMAVKAFNEDGNGTVDWAVAAIEYAIANGARIINASWGLEDRSRALADAVAEAQAAGVIFVAAAGNSRTDTPFYPAGYESVIAVASVGNRGERSNFSNYGPHVDISAPGEQILSTMPDGRYDLVSGTSMSTPHVSGVAALVLSRHPEFTAPQVATILKNTADPITSDRAIGRGRVNAYAAVQIELPLPNAILRVPATVSGRIDLRGTASGDHFQRYALYHGDGAQPTTWTEIFNATTSVNDGLLFGGFDTSTLNDGTHTLKVVVWNDNGQSASDLVTVHAINVQILSPLSSDVLRSSEPLVVRGTVFGQGRHYGVSLSKGLKQTNWVTTGISQPTTGEVVNDILATIDPSALTPNEFHSIRLSATNAAGQVQIHRASFVWADSRLRPGFPIHLAFEGEFPFEDWRQTKVVDLDGDGHKEILLVDHGNSEGKIARLLVYHDDGTLAWSRELNGEEPYADVPTVGDINGDGIPEIFVDVGPTLYAFTNTGENLPGAWPLTLGSRRLGKVIADLDGDGKNELIALANSPAPNSDGSLSLTVYDGLGLTLQRWPISNCASTNLTQRNFPVVANLDAGPGREIVIAAKCFGVSLYGMSHPEGAIWNTELTGVALTSPVVGDVDNDGKNDIVIATSSPEAGVPAGVFLLNNKGEVKPGWPVLSDDSFETSPVLGDIDGDGKLEICVPGSRSYRLHLLEEDGFEAVGWPVSVGLIGASSYASFADITGDSIPEIVFTGPGYMEFAIWDADKQYVGGVFAWDRFGQKIPLSGIYPSIPIESSASAGYWKSAALSITDLDGNGKLDLIATSIDEGNYEPLDGGDSYYKRRSSIYAWELNTPVTQIHSPWVDFQHAPDNNGFLPSEIPPPPIIELLQIPDQIVAVGHAFQPIPLNQYLLYSGVTVPTLHWSASGQSQLLVQIDNDGVATISAPSPIWQGSERITFTVTDNATFTLSTNALFEARLNFFPPIALEDHASIAEDEVAIIDVLANDTNPGGGALTIEATTPPAHGQAALTDDGRIQYTPETNYFGADSFSYIIRNAIGASTLGLVNIEISSQNDAPAAVDDRSLALEDRGVTIDVLANDFDADGDSIQITDVTQPSNGVTVVTAQNKIFYQPQSAFHGTNIFNYTITDGKGATSIGHVTVVVRALNTAPVAKPQDIVMNRNNTKDIIYLGEDLDGDPLTFRIIQPPAHGDLFSYPTLGSYVPLKGFSGTDSFSYKATDGFLESAEAIINITILDANNPPTVRPLAVTTRVNQAANFSIDASDLDDDPITFELVELPKNGIVSGASSNYVYTPNLDYLGKDEFSIRVSDGRDSTVSKISIQTTDKNTAPGANPKQIKTEPNTEISFALTGADAESDPLHFTLLGNPKHGSLTGSAPFLVYHPDLNYLGPDRFFFTVNDSEFTSDPAPVTISVSVKNTVPFAADQTVVATALGPVAVKLNVKDAENDPLEAVILKGPRGGRLSGSGTNFIYTPGPGFTGADTFSYKAWDGHNYGNEASVRIERNIVQTPPPVFNGIQVTDGGQLQLSLTNKLGQSFRIESSTNLKDWKLVTTAVSPGTFLFTLPVTDSQIFFRAINQ